MKSRKNRIRTGIRDLLPRRWLWILSAAILILLLLLLFLPRLLPNNNPVDPYAYYGIGKEDTVVFINTERVEMEILREDGEIYLPLEDVNAYLNQRFYADRESGSVLYTLPDRMDEFTAEDRTFSRGGSDAVMKHAPYIIRRGTGYLSLEVVEDYTRLQYELLTEPDRLWLWTAFDEEIPYLHTEKPVYLRTGAGKGNPVLNREDPDDTYILISEEGAWRKVISAKGHIGYISGKDVKEMDPQVRSGAFFEEQLYGTDQMDGKVSMGFDYIDDVSYGLDMLKLHLKDKEAINVVCPTWFVLQGNDGEFTSCADPAYVRLAHKNKIRVWVMIENITGNCDSMALFSSRKARENLIRNLTDAVKEYQLDGINLDIESLTAESVPHYLEFIRELSLALHGTGTVLSSDTYAPYPWNLKYDLPELAKLLDYVVIMGYDESWDTPGPNSDKEFITFCCEKSLLSAPKEKLIIAIPFYTRGWASKDDGSFSRAEIRMKNSVELLETCKDKKWLEDKGCWHGHVVVDGVTREVWFEDPESTEIRISIIASHDVAGLAYWRLSQEAAEVWDIVKKYGFYQ